MRVLSRTKKIYWVYIFVIIVGIFSDVVLCVPSSYAESDAAVEKNDVATNETDATRSDVPLVGDAALGVPMTDPEIDHSDVMNMMIGSAPEEMKSIRMRPVFVEGEPVGIEIQWIANDNVLFKYGIRKGDVIKSIVGIPMKNMGDFTKAIYQAENRTPFTAQITRGDSSVQLIYGERLYMPLIEIDRFRLRPIFEKDGYQSKWVEIMRLRNDSVLFEIGLQNKDAIISFDGFSIKYANDLINSVNRAMRKPSFEINIVRNNEPMVVMYVVEQK